MNELPAGLQSRKFPRAVAYAVVAAFVTIALFAADGAYRWYRGKNIEAAAPTARERSVRAPDPAPVEVPASPPQALSAPPERETQEIDRRAEERPAVSPVATPARGAVPDPQAGIDAAGIEVATPASATAPKPAVASAPAAAVAPVPRATTVPAPERAAPQRARPKSLPQPRQVQVRRKPKTQAVQHRAAPRRPMQAAKPNVYFERDSQLGFASQLRKRTCNPATGNMPMQCYYPREGRERFPAKPLN
jgi:hypothetical protein